MSEAKKLSRGYAPASHEELDAAISGDAFRFLLRIRADCDGRETDGHIATRHLDALAVAYGMSDDIKRTALSELVKAKLVHEKRDGYLDVNFLEWCRPASKREKRRAQWRAYNEKRPHQPSSLVEPPVSTTTAVTTVVTTALEAVAEKEAEKEKQQLASEPAVASEDTMPRQGDTITILEGWESIVGRPSRLDEISRVGWLLDQYSDRLTANQILEVIERTHSREMTRGNPTHPLTYYDGPIRDAHGAAKPSRLAEVVGKGEPPPVEPQNGHASVEQARQLRQMAAGIGKRL
jgi:hypothetical protein